METIHDPLLEPQTKGIYRQLLEFFFFKKVFMQQSLAQFSNRLVSRDKKQTLLLKLYFCLGWLLSKMCYVNLRRKTIFFCCFFPFCRPGVSPKHSYTPESVCPRFSDEFFKKMDHQNVKIADFTIKAHFWATHKFWTDIAAAWRSATSITAKF